MIRRMEVTPKKEDTLIVKKEEELRKMKSWILLKKAKFLDKVVMVKIGRSKLRLIEKSFHQVKITIKRKMRALKKGFSNSNGKPLALETCLHRSNSMQ
jgi:hypothetical protein